MSESTRTAAARRARPDEAGLTLLEVLISAMVISMIAMMVVEAVRTVGSAQAQQRAKAHVTEVADRAIRLIEQDVISAINLFTEGSASRDYLARLDMSVCPMLPGERLPLLTTRGYFDVDPPDRVETGNMLLLGRSHDPMEVTVTDAVGVETEVRVDAHQIVVYHLTRARDGAVDLARWASTPLASYGDLASIESAEVRAEVVRTLHAGGVRHAWDAMRPAADALFTLDDQGAIAPLDPAVQLPLHWRQSVTSVFGPRAVRIAEPATLTRVPVAVFTSALVPDAVGFEVKIDGPPTGKLVLLRLVLQSSEHVRRGGHVVVERRVNSRGG